MRSPWKRALAGAVAGFVLAVASGAIAGVIEAGRHQDRVVKLAAGISCGLNCAVFLALLAVPAGVAIGWWSARRRAVPAAPPR
jgi:hypothetical protein